MYKIMSDLEMNQFKVEFYSSRAAPYVSKRSGATAERSKCKQPHQR